MFSKSTFAVKLGAFATLVSCASAGPAKPVILDQSTGGGSAPKWVDSFEQTGKVRTKAEDGKPAFITRFTMESDSRTDACVQGAEALARSEIGKSIGQSILDYVVTESAAKSAASTRINQALSRERISGIETEGTYWKMVEKTISGVQKRELECFALVAISESNFKKLQEKSLKSISEDKTAAAVIPEIIAGMKADK